MSAPFTPGPWTAERHPTGWQIDASHDAVATTAFCYAREADANAHLIASAPALYGALKAIDDMWSNCDEDGRVNPIDARSGQVREVWERTRAALALARGEHPAVEEA